MAQGDITWFNAAKVKIGNGAFNLGADTLRVGIIKSAANGGVDPTASLADPRWGVGGSTNLSSSQVATGGTSYTGPVALANKTWGAVGSAGVLRADPITLAQDPSGFTNGRWAIIYDDTVTGKDAIAFVDLGSDRSLVTGALNIDWNGVSNDILQIQ